MTDRQSDVTERLSPTDDGVSRAAEHLRAGRLVAFPTETVYGLGGDATSAEAVAAIYGAKGRPSHNPLIVHLAEAGQADRLAELTPEARLLAERHWPGPLTLVLPLRASAPLPPGVTAGLPSVALRVPAHPLARRLLAEVGRPVAAPSANPSGGVSPTTAAHVLAGLSGRIAAVLDGGPCAVGLESTILGFEDGRPVLLRPGGLPAEMLAETLGRPVEPRSADAGITAPGQLASHYAPGASLRLSAEGPEDGEGWLGFGPLPEGLAGPALTLSAKGDLAEAAANLFAHLRRLDAELGPGGRIAVAAVPDHGLGAAINDRLARAAAPRW